MNVVGGNSEVLEKLVHGLPTGLDVTFHNVPARMLWHAAIAAVEGARRRRNGDWDGQQPVTTDFEDGYGGLTWRCLTTVDESGHIAVTGV